MTDEICNPWAVTHIDSFNFLCCPECNFRSKEISNFQKHATENHPKSEVFFHSGPRKAPKLGSNLFYCCPECVYKSEDVSLFQIHALENHPTSLTFFSRDYSLDKEKVTRRNPWDKDSIEDFRLFCCSHCPFTSRGNTNYDNHIEKEHFQSEKESIEYSEIKSEIHDVNRDTFDSRFTEQKGFELDNARNHEDQSKSQNDTLEYFSGDIEIKNDLETLSYAKEGPEILEGEKLVDLKKTAANNYLKNVKVNTIDTADETNIKKKSSILKTEIKLEDKMNKAPKIYVCSLCSQDFRTQKDLKMHNRMNKTYSCPVCSKNFCKRNALRDHQRTIHANIPCDVCSMIFVNPAKLNRHKREKHATKKCEICSKIIVASMKRHIVEVHTDKPIELFKCDQPNCSFSAKRKSNLHLHKARCQTKKDYACKICSKLFPLSHIHSESQYIKHYKAEHNDIPPEFKDKEQFLCSECPETFFNKIVFNTHVWNHKNSSEKLNLMKKFECKTCQTTIFGRKNYVEHCKDVHNEIVSRSESIECNSCEEKFRAPTFYIQHYQSVHGDLPPEYLDKELFVCDQCPQVFISKISLSAHIENVHNADNKFKKKDGKKCPHCEKRFQNNNNYLEHVKSKHEKKTPFQCDECDRSYATNRKLTNHKQLVHQRVKCDVCGKEICNSFILKRHKASVHGITPKDAYQCEKCTSFFSTQTSLDKHVNSKH